MDGSDDSIARPLTPAYPFRVEFEITSACNLNCIYCYAKPFTNKIPPIEDIKYLFGKTAEEANPFEVVLVGGEPFIRKDIIDVLRYAKDSFEKSSIGVSTNGTLIPKLTESQLAELSSISSNLPMIQVSLDSADPAINDLTRNFGKLTLEGMKVLDKHDIPFSVGIIPTALNKESIPITVRKLLGEYKSIRLVNIETLQPTYTMTSKTFFDLGIKPDELKILRGRINEEVELSGRKEVKVSVENPVENSGNCSNPLINMYGLNTCTAGLFRAGVFTDGTVTPCLIIRNVGLGNLFKESWSIIWERSKARYFGISENAGQCTIINLLRKNDRIKEKTVMQ